MKTHVLHIGKTGGTALRVALEQATCPNAVVHGHEFKLADVPEGDGAIFCVRSPIDRFVSGFNSRRRKGQPRYNVEWSANERLVFETFGTPDQLAQGLYSPDDRTKVAARAAVSAITHTARHLTYWLGTAHELRVRVRRIAYIAYQPELDADLPFIARALSVDRLELPTALYSHFSDVPGLNVSITKELHYFDDENEDWFSPDYKGYEANFRNRPGLRGEVTPIYSYWPGTMERIHAYNSNMKVIFIARDRIQRAWSHWAMEISRGAETLPFAEAIRGGRSRVVNGPGSRLGRHRVYSYVERVFCAPQIDNIIRLFGVGNIHVLSSLDLRKSPQVELQKVSEFLGVYFPQIAMTRRSIHVGSAAWGSGPAVGDRRYLSRVFSEDSQRFYDLTGVVVSTDPFDA